MKIYQWPERLFINDGEAMGGTWLFTKEQLEFCVKELNKVCPPDDDFPPLTFEKAVYQEYDFEHIDKADPNTAYYSAWFYHGYFYRTTKKLSVIKVVGSGDTDDGVWDEEQTKNPTESYYSYVDDDEDDENVVEILKSHGEYNDPEDAETLKDFIDRAVRPLMQKELNQ